MLSYLVRTRAQLLSVGFERPAPWCNMGRDNTNRVRSLCMEPVINNLCLAQIKESASRKIEATKVHVIVSTLHDVGNLSTANWTRPMLNALSPFHSLLPFGSLKTWLWILLDHIFNVSSANKWESGLRKCYLLSLSLIFLICKKKIFTLQIIDRNVF